ncbi:MAG: type IV toxin-antitoxin system AbiEi family antitoxin domain-containing protein [Propionibacteriaceae bacterium]|nr:type IV toxin-antitoxin system AbiEi family antitoxin domain-containing protein [Propionibacteriaceae bacterium]
MASDLPAAFTLAQARERGWGKDAVYRLVDQGRLDRVGRGVFADLERIDPALAVLAGATAVQPMATLCLASALVRHDLSDAILAVTDIALPRGVRHPAGFDHATWHSFCPDMFTIGRESFDACGMTLHVYSAERTVVDCFRFAHLEGADTATAALKRWLRQPGHSPSVLLAAAAAFPPAQTRIRQVLEVLL